MLGLILTGAVSVIVSIAIVWFFLMDSGTEETYAVGFHYTPESDPELLEMKKKGA